MIVKTRDATIINELGLHARSAAKIAKIAQNSKATVWIHKGKEQADASSIIDILTLGCDTGTRITVSIEDPTDIDILNDIFELLANGFDE